MEERGLPKPLTIYLTISAIVSAASFVVGRSGSLSLLSTAFHSIFDVITIGISLLPMILDRYPPNEKYSYGYDRLIVIASFSNAVFLLFASVFLLFECVERMIADDHHEAEITTSYASSVVIVTIAGLCIRLAGIFLFPSSRARSEGHSKEDLWLHAMTDTVASIAVVVSTYLTGSGVVLADPIVAMFIVGLIVYNAYPVCRKTSAVLLQTTPVSLKEQLDKAIREATTLEGVVECKNEHFWTHAPGIYVGSLYVRVRTDATEQQREAVLYKVRALFAPYIQYLTVQLEKDDWLLPGSAHPEHKI
eukprot:TRINITY_DN19611_c0_g1_i1.p1 TRINITY_DN19611_c0_g1~~TRINITY_DN19611_c0_g1_i1.p1  ORF type:complete len:305 (-),score=64.34 TRINITY_DN19611_c0_g1_i1:56-970(-)